MYLLSRGMPGWWWALLPCESCSLAQALAHERCQTTFFLVGASVSVGELLGGVSVWVLKGRAGYGSRCLAR